MSQLSTPGSGDIRRRIRSYHGCTQNEHHRYRSWEYCYRYFRGRETREVAADIDLAALHLGFYLASWGMYRGSSFLLQHAYTVHRGVVEKLSKQFSDLWGMEFGGGDNDARLIPLMLKACTAVREAYRPFAPSSELRQASDTLVTKVILGTFGCLPACDRFFIDGFKSSGLQYSHVNANFAERLLRFTRDNLSELRNEQAEIDGSFGIRYPLMKLVDMYFWEIGFERSKPDIGIVSADPKLVGIP